MLKFLLNICETHEQQYSEEHPAVEDFTDMHQVRCLEQYHSQKNTIPHFKEHCSKIDISLVINFFFSQTNAAFKYNPLFIDTLDSFCHSLFTFTDFEVYSMPLRLFYKNQ